MKLLRTATQFALLASLTCLPSLPRLAAERDLPSSQLRPESQAARAALWATYHAGADADSGRVRWLPDDKGGGIREVVPVKYKTRYQEWKDEFLATEMGRRQWALYEQNPNFTLTIVIARENNRGAGTGQYKWDEKGRLVAATITLGSNLDQGYPNPIYYPVMNSLTPHESSNVVSGDVLAATKIAHEFGHLTRTAEADATLYQLQAQLIPLYNKILMSNGRNTADPQLLELAQQMGGTPVEIWEDREYWGETNAMLYLRDRFAEDGTRCMLFNRIRHSVNLYAKSYAERFLKIAQSTPSPNRCGWD